MKNNIDCISLFIEFILKQLIGSFETDRTNESGVTKKISSIEIEIENLTRKRNTC